MDILDVLHAEHPAFYLEHTGGGCMALIADGLPGTVVVTDDGDAVLVGFYPGTNWGDGEDTGNVLEAYPVGNLPAVHAGIHAALRRIGA